MSAGGIDDLLWSKRDGGSDPDPKPTTSRAKASRTDQISGYIHPE
jgi:hypothetical protein